MTNDIKTQVQKWTFINFKKKNQKDTGATIVMILDFFQSFFVFLVKKMYVYKNKF